MENASLELADAPTDVVGIRAAASELGISASTVSRQVKSGVIPNRGTEREPKLSIAEARKARAANIDPAQQRVANHPPAPSGFQAQRSAHEEIKTKKAAIELAQLQGALMARADVEDFLVTAARQFRDKLLHRWRTMAVELEGLSAREIEAKGVTADEVLLSALADQFETWSTDAAGVA